MCDNSITVMQEMSLYLRDANDASNLALNSSVIITLPKCTKLEN